MDWLIVIGAGGHARSVIDAVQVAGMHTIVGALSADPAQWGTDLLGVPVLGGDDLLPTLAERGVRLYVLGVGSTADTHLRQKLAANAEAQGFQPVTVIHPTATCARSAVLGAGVQVLAGSVINAAAKIGDHVVVNTSAVVEHDCRVADHAFIAPRVCLCGNVVIEHGAHIGAGAVIREKVRIGAHAVVGAGAVVVKPVAAGRVVVGVPARPIQPESADAED